MLTWMRNKMRICLACDTLELHKVNIAIMTNDNNVMRGSVWFGFFGGLF